MSAAERLREGQTFGRYKIVRQIGEGGMGVVYEAIHPGLKRRFAIKTLLPEGAQKEEARVRFLREGEAASSINHPNVVVVSDVGMEDGIPYLVMDFLEGQTLADLLTKRGALAIQESIALLLPVISAVATGHDRGVIHRDLKPQNIFLATGAWGEPIPKVLDFGVSKLTGDETAVITRTLSVLGTAAYMSPEQARGAKRVSFPSDQYALGLIFYEMLTGTRAHPGENALEILHNVTTGLIRPARDLRPDLSDDLNAVLSRMLAISPAERYPSLHDCGHALVQFADDKTRMAMTDAFSGAKANRQAASQDGIAAGSPPASPSRSEPSSGSGVGRTIAFPGSATNSPSDTTLRRSAAEAIGIDEMVLRPSGSKKRVGLAVGVGLAVVAVGAVLVKVINSPSMAEQFQVPSPTSVGMAEPIGRVPSVSAHAAPKPEAAPSIPFEIRAWPSESEIALDDGPPAHGRLEIILPLGGTSHQIRVSADGYLPKVVSFGPSDRPPSEIRLERQTVAQTPQVADRTATSKEAATSPHSGIGKPTLRRAMTSESKPTKKPSAAGSMISTRPPPAEPIAPTKPADVAATTARGSNNSPILKN